MKTDIISFYNFIYDRQLVWYNKEHVKNPYPWTEDKILKTFKFCNVYRELDRGSLYLIHSIIKNKNLSFNDKFLNCIAYRRFNLPGFFNWVGGPMSSSKFDFKKYSNLLDARKKDGQNLFNDAYIVTQAVYYRESGRKDKFIQQLYILKDLASFITKHEPFWAWIVEMDFNMVHGFLKKHIFGMGDFLAYQTLTDLTYFPEIQKLKCWSEKEINSFVAMGPGSRPGIRLLFPTRVKTKKGGEYESLCIWLFEHQQEYFNQLKKKTGKDWLKIRYSTPYYSKPYLSLSNIQNSLCEYRKYVMLQLDPNKKKRYYNPGGVKYDIRTN